MTTCWALCKIPELRRKLNKMINQVSSISHILPFYDSLSSSVLANAFFSLPKVCLPRKSKLLIEILFYNFLYTFSNLVLRALNFPKEIWTTVRGCKDKKIKQVNWTNEICLFLCIVGIKIIVRLFEKTGWFLHITGFFTRSTYYWQYLLMFLMLSVFACYFKHIIVQRIRTLLILIKT